MLEFVSQMPYDLPLKGIIGPDGFVYWPLANSVVCTSAKFYHGPIAPFL